MGFAVEVVGEELVEAGGIGFVDEAVADAGQVVALLIGGAEGFPEAQSFLLVTDGAAAGAEGFQNGGFFVAMCQRYTGFQW